MTTDSAPLNVTASLRFIGGANGTNGSSEATTATHCSAADGCAQVWPVWVSVGVPLMCVALFVLTLLLIFFWPTICRSMSPAKTPNIEMRPLKTRRPKNDRLEAARQSLINERDVEANVNGNVRTA